MSQRSWTVIAALWLCPAAVLGWVPTGASAEAPAADKGEDKPAAKAAAGKDVFGLTKVQEFHLAITAKEYEKMQPAGGMPFPGGPGSPERPAEKPAETPADTHKGSGFGAEFPWAHGELTAEGKTYKNVGVRYKGNFTYMASSGVLKRSLKIDFDHYDDAQRFHGLRKINLNSGVTDPARMREALSFAVFRAVGVPAPRTAYAQLTLTVPGKYDREYVGVCTLIEQVDRAFLKDHFTSAKGLLLKPEGVRGLEYLGEDWEPYAQRYLPKAEAGKEQQKRLIELTRLVNRADDVQFRKEIASYLDVDAFLRFLAANALLANLDSFLAFGHNYYLYLRPDTNQFVFIPWDLDLSFGTWPMGGTAEQQMDLSLTHPHPGENKLIDRLLAVKDVSEKYQKLLRELAATCFTKEKLLKEIDAIEKATKGPLAREKKAVAARKERAAGFGFGPPGGNLFGQSPSLKTFVEKRTESVAAQLAGKSKGYVPGMGFGPGGPPQPGQIMPPFLQEVLRLTPEQKKQIEELQKEVDGKVGKILTEEQKKQFKEMQQGFGRGGPGGFGRGGPGGFGPGGPPGGGFGPPGGPRGGGPREPPKP